MKLVPINQEWLGKLLSKLPEEKHEMVKKEIGELNKVVSQIENSIATTQYHYGEYMAIVKDMTTAVLLLAAGANLEGIKWAVRLNGLS